MVVGVHRRGHAGRHGAAGVRPESVAAGLGLKLAGLGDPPYRHHPGRLRDGDCRETAIVSRDIWRPGWPCSRTVDSAELYLERPPASLVGNIYKGRVENVLPGMDAAFVDIGLERNGFLYVDEVVAARGSGPGGHEDHRTAQGRQGAAGPGDPRPHGRQGTAPDHSSWASPGGIWSTCRGGHASGCLAAAGGRGAGAAAG